MTRSLQAVAYTRPSVRESVVGGQRLGLETSRGATPTGAASSGLPADRIRAALTRLGASGRVGYDTAEAAYFHRELPTTPTASSAAIRACARRALRWPRGRSPWTASSAR
ncbi:hypothetical protein [Streptomyces sp. DSM 40750]|uniref:hypothetical protein n=1 Tax=Streptomyces sp. DSM 40750 TaxID=2801030 RepID=UPI003FA74517